MRLSVRPDFLACFVSKLNTKHDDSTIILSNHLMTAADRPSGYVLALISALSICVALALMSVVLQIVFDLRHTTDFATAQLSARGYAHITIHNEQLIGGHDGLLNFPQANQFDFVAIKNGQQIHGALECFRAYRDLIASRCRVEVGW